MASVLIAVALGAAQLAFVGFFVYQRLFRERSPRSLIRSSQ
jgi:hypothetical protein